MRVLLVGAGVTGKRVLQQLQKNPRLEVLTADPQKKPYAVAQGVIESVDFQEVLTPLTLEYIVSQAAPDLILIATETEDLGLGTAAGVEMLAEALREEIASLADVPVIEVARA